MKTTLRASNLSEKQIEEIYAVLRLICEQEKLQLEERGDRVVVEVCPQGTIECVQTGDRMTIEAHTSHGGPGFHAYCVNLLEWIEEECTAACVVSDDCGFVENPDFSHLKYEVFYPWLGDLKRLLLEGHWISRTTILTPPIIWSSNERMSSSHRAALSIDMNLNRWTSRSWHRISSYGMKKRVTRSFIRTVRCICWPKRDMAAMRG